MHVYIPKEAGGLDDFLLVLKNTSMDQIRGHIREPGNCEMVQLSLPKFKTESELKLMEALKQVKHKPHVINMPSAIYCLY